MKKILSLALALVLSLSLAVPVFAAERPEKEDAGITGNYTLTRRGADVGHFAEKPLPIGILGAEDENETIQGCQPIPADTTWTFTNTSKDPNTYLGIVITPLVKYKEGDRYYSLVMDDAYLRRDGSFAYGIDGYRDPEDEEFTHVYPGQSVTFTLADAMKCLKRDPSEDLLYCVYIWQNHSDNNRYEEAKYYYKIGTSGQGPVIPPETDPVEKFTDVKAGAWYVDAIKYVLNKDLFKGTSLTTFSPDTPMTRAMFVVVLARSVGASQEGEKIWYDKDVQWAIANGYYDGRGPEGNIPRQEMALMLYRRAGSPAVSGSLKGFADAGAVSAEAKTAMLWAVQKGYIKGAENNRLNPNGGATRAEVATIFMRVFG